MNETHVFEVQMLSWYNAKKVSIEKIYHLISILNVYIYKYMYVLSIYASVISTFSSGNMWDLKCLNISKKYQSYTFIQNVYYTE